MDQHEPVRKHAHARHNTAEELTLRNVETIAKIEETIESRRSKAEHQVDKITKFSGTLAFLWLHAVWFIGWITVNTCLPEPLRFDRYPFNFLTMVVSLEAIVLSTLIMITQNRQAEVADLRNHLDLQINLLSEQENTKMLKMMEAIHVKLGIHHADGEREALEEATQPESLIRQIERLIENKHGS